MKKEEKPKILIVTGVLWIGGGAEKVAANLGNYFTDQGYETHLLTFYEAPNKYPYHGIYHSFNETPKTAFQKIFRVPMRVWKIAQYAKKNNIDVAYTFLEEANFYTLTAKLLFYRKLDVIVSVRNNINKRGKIFRTISRLLYPHAKKVVSVTRTIEHTLKNDLELKNTTAIYNSIDSDFASEKSEEPLADEYQQLFKSSPVLISAGRLIQQKGQWHLIRAFSEVVKKHPDAILIILGEGEYRSKLEKLIKDSGLENNVHLIGNQANVYQFLSRADIFIFSSLWEGMPNTMLEALSVGLPIISTDCVSGPREIISPELSIEQLITYPHKTDFGILVKTPKNLAPTWRETDKVPLTVEETQLQQAVEQLINDHWFRGDQYTSHKLHIATTFERDSIMAQWAALL